MPKKKENIEDAVRLWNHVSEAFQKPLKEEVKNVTG